MKISFWIDFKCPYSYIGYTRLNNTLNELKLNNTKYDIHAFETKTNKNLQNKEEIELITKLAREEQLEFNPENLKTTKTNKAHRLIKLAIQNNNQEMIKNTIQNLFESAFIDEEDLNDDKILLKIGIQSGLNPEEIQQLLSSDTFKDEVTLDKRVADDTNIMAVPYFILNNKYPLPGILPKKELKNVIKKVKFEEDIMIEYEKTQKK